MNLREEWLQKGAAFLIVGVAAYVLVHAVGAIVELEPVERFLRYLSRNIGHVGMPHFDRLY
ncbi:MAG TPA: hypothetical protein VEA36_00455 [Candidatus Paceibacterota bacterium]|nr:hypothetical protein [Candidatus Paceibacterota bacterium]